MTRVETKLKLSDEKFKRRIGTTKPVFQMMLYILQTAYDELHRSGGKPPDLAVGDKLLITLKCWSCSEIVDWLPETLVFTGDTCPFQQIQNTT